MAVWSNAVGYKDIMTADEKNVANGIAGLDGSAKVPAAQLPHPIKGGTFTCAAATTTVVADTAVTAGSLIVLQATNAAAALLMQGAHSLYISEKSAGVSFTVATQDAGAAAGTETFAYHLVD